MVFVQHFSKNENGRDFVISDIHANKKAFFKALESVGFDKTIDRLFSLGDLIDRGEDNLCILKMLNENDWFYAIRGNHEQMLLNCYKPNTAIKTAKAFKNHRTSGGDWFHNIESEALKQEIREQLETLPIAISLETELGEIGLVHGEVPKSLSDWPVFTMILEGLIKHEFLSVDEIKESAVWGREAIIDGYDYFSGRYIPAEYQIKRSINGVDLTVHGHTQVKEPVIWGNQIWIDTFGKTGELTILLVEKLFDLVAFD